MESSEMEEEEVKGLPPGHLARFLESFTEEQKRQWRPIRRVWKRDIRRAAGRPDGCTEDQSARSNRDPTNASLDPTNASRDPANSGREPASSNRNLLYNSMNQAQGKITAEKIERLIDNAVAKGDAQALRVMAQMAGMDLADRPKQAVGEGAKVIIIRPHPMLLTPEEEADVQAQSAVADIG